MPPFSPSSPKLRFGAFILDPTSGQLRKSETLLRLPPQPFRLLQLLMERAGEVVTREEIRNCLWTDATFVDFEHGINFSINQIRSVLADNAEKPRYIETLPRRGYRFIAPVEALNGHAPVPRSNFIEEVDSSPDIESLQFPSMSRGATTTLHVSTVTIDTGSHAVAEPQVKSQPVTEKKGKASRGRWLVAAGLATVGVVGVIFLYRLINPQPPHILRIEQLTQSGHVDAWQSLVSDGRRLFYLEREGDHWNGMEILTSGGEGHQLASRFPNTNTKIFAISPDGSQLLVAPFPGLRQNLPLWITPLVGGAPRRIGDLTANSATFSPDGTQIALTNQGGVFVSDLNGGNIRKIAGLPGEAWSVAWSPDGKRIRFAQTDYSAETAVLWEVSTQDGDLHPVLPRSVHTDAQCCGRWNSDGSYYFFVVSDKKSGNLWALKEPPRRLPWLHYKPVPLSTGPVSFGEAVSAADGNRIYAHGGAELLDVYFVDPKSAQEKLFMPGQHALDAGFSSDGKWMFYVTSKALWRCRPDGSERQQFASNSPDLFLNTPRWRPDSKDLLFFEMRKGGFNQMYVVSTEGGPRRAILGDDHLHEVPDWSPDGQTIVFTLDDPTQQGQASANGIYLYDLRNAQTTPIPDSANLTQARWSPDGRYLAAVSLDSSKIELYDFSEKRWNEIARGNWMTLPVWSADSKFVYYQDFLMPGQPVFRYRLLSASAERVFSFEGLLKTLAGRCTLLGLTPDGSLIVRTSGSGGNLFRLDLDLP